MYRNVCSTCTSVLSHTDILTFSYVLIYDKNLFRNRGMVSGRPRKPQKTSEAQNPFTEFQEPTEKLRG